MLSLSESRESITRVTQKEKDTSVGRKILIQEKKKQKRKNGRENTKQLTRKKLETKLMKAIIIDKMCLNVENCEKSQ